MNTLSKTCKPMAALLGAATLALVASLAPVAAQDNGEPYSPTVWIDPDGCEHWVMDDGAEGYMDARQTRDGRPVCHRNVCGVIPTDTLFATDSAKLTASGRATLQGFFQSAQARSFIITGHTDSRASDEYNMNLSDRRARAVGDVARSVGAVVERQIGFGERQPIADNGSAAGMQKTRRVEVVCYTWGTSN